jgi:hypothetical protein
VSFGNAQVCERNQTLTVEQQAQALASNDRSDPECTAFLIVRLGESHYEQASQTVVNYLDFEWHNHWVAEEDQGTRLPWAGNRFPAIEALYSIGDKAVPAMIEYLASADRPVVGRKNALLLFLLLDRHGDFLRGVRILAQASRAPGKDPIAAGRLWQAANAVAAMCPEDQGCQAALIAGPPE